MTDEQNKGKKSSEKFEKILLEMMAFTSLAMGVLTINNYQINNNNKKFHETPEVRQLDSIYKSQIYPYEKTYIWKLDSLRTIYDNNNTKR